MSSSNSACESGISSSGDRETVIWSPLANRHVDDALPFIAADDPVAARQWLESLLERVSSLATFPESGRVVPEYGRADVREILVGSYRVMYRRRANAVEVAAIHHHARQVGVQEVEP
jgi:toxin ParE1/3/4